MTSQALDILHQEHRTIGRMLELFERQVVLLEKGLQADVDVLKEIVDFFRTFPDVYHHPKEDLIARLVTRRDAEAGAPLSRLADEHEACSAQLMALTRAMVDLLLEPERTTTAFISIARRFLDAERRHVAWEDANFFDLAAAVLTAEDWAEVDRRFANLATPRFEHLARDRFANITTEAARWRR